MQEILHKDGTDLAHRKLWRSVIILAVKDACGVSDGRKPPSESVRGRAQNWLLKGSRDLYMVCEFAQISPDVVMAAGRSLKKRGWTVPKRFFRSPTEFGAILHSVEQNLGVLKVQRDAGR